jgi:hypothetical protein
MPTFSIEKYKVASYLWRSKTGTNLERVLEMAGPVLYHDIQNHAVFAFASYFNIPVWNEPVAGYLTGGGTVQGLSVIGWFPVAEFSDYYDILRSERPVHVFYEFRDAGAMSGYLKKVGLGTSTEPIGEGPSESDKQISAALMQFLSLRREVPMPTKKQLPKR